MTGTSKAASRPWAPEAARLLMSLGTGRRAMMLGQRWVLKVEGLTKGHASRRVQAPPQRFPVSLCEAKPSSVVKQLIDALASDLFNSVRCVLSGT
jgi:hypothetical protein